MNFVSHYIKAKLFKHAACALQLLGSGGGRKNSARLSLKVARGRKNEVNFISRSATKGERKLFLALSWYFRKQRTKNSESAYSCGITANAKGTWMRFQGVYSFYVLSISSFSFLAVAAKFS